MPLEKRGRKEKDDAKDKSLARRKQRKAKKDGVVLKKGRPTKSQSQTQSKKSQSQTQSQSVNITIGDPKKKTRSKSAPHKQSAPRKEPLPASIPQDLRPTINIPAQPDYSGVFQALIQQQNRPQNETPLNRSMFENMVLGQATINEPVAVRRHGRTASSFQQHPTANVLSPIDEVSRFENPIDEFEPVARARADIDPNARRPFITDETPMDSGLLSLMIPSRPEPSKMKTNMKERRGMAGEDMDAPSASSVSSISLPYSMEFGEQEVMSDITDASAPYGSTQQFSFTSQPSEKTLFGDFETTLSSGSLLYDPRERESVHSSVGRLDEPKRMTDPLMAEDLSSESSPPSSIRSEQPALSRNDALRIGYEDTFDEALSRNELFLLPSDTFEYITQKQRDIYNDWYSGLNQEVAFAVREADNFPQRESEISGDIPNTPKEKKAEALATVKAYKEFKVPNTDLNVLGLVGLKYPDIKIMIMNGKLGKRIKTQYDQSVNAFKKLQDLPEQSEAQMEAVKTTEELKRLLPQPIFV